MTRTRKAEDVPSICVLVIIERDVLHTVRQYNFQKRKYNFMKKESRKRSAEARTT